jgi:neutral ceramidase
MHQAITCALILAAALILGAAGTPTQAQEPATFQVGIAQVDITPEGPAWLGGFGGRTKPSEGVERNLIANCLVFDNGTDRVGFMALDGIAVPQKSMDVIRDAAEQAGIPRAHMMVNHSHSHFAPGFGDANADYVELFNRRTMEAVDAAVADLQPAILDFTVGSCTMGMNRRQIGPDGKVVGMAPEPRRPIDLDVPVLRVISPEGQVRAILFGYACHPTTVTGSLYYQVCTDFPGYARDWVAAAYPGAMPAFVQGCCGDIKPRNIAPRPDRLLDPSRFNQTLLLDERGIRASVGYELGRAVVAALAVPPPPITSSQLGGLSVMVDLPRKTDPAQTIQKEVQVLRIGDLYVAGFNDEILVAIGLRLKRELAEQDWFDGSHAWVNGYTNTRQLGSYVPPAEDFELEGYEVRTSRVAPGADDILVNTAIELTRMLHTGQ